MNNVIATPVFVKEFKVRAWKVRLAWDAKTKVAVLIALSIIFLAIPRMVS